MCLNFEQDKTKLEETELKLKQEKILNVHKQKKLTAEQRQF